MKSHFATLVPASQPASVTQPVLHLTVGHPKNHFEWLHSSMPPYTRVLASFLSTCHKRGASGKKELPLRRCPPPDCLQTSVQGASPINDHCGGAQHNASRISLHRWSLGTRESKVSEPGESSQQTAFLLQFLGFLQWSVAWQTSAR